MLRRMRTPLFAAALVCAIGCGHDETTADLIADGSYGIGVHTFTFVDTSRPTPANGSYAGDPARTLVVDVWYPSSMPGGPSTDPPLRKGTYPLILHSHGFMDSRTGESYLGEHLATRGYIVAAPDYPLSKGGAPGGPTIADTAQQPLDARFVIDQLLAQSAMPSSPIAGAIDSSRIGVSGLSLGGLTTLLIAFHPTLGDPRVKAAMAWAAPSCMLEQQFFAGSHLPLLLLHGEGDAIVPLAANSQRIFPFTQSPSELIVLHGGSHTGFATLASLLDQTMNLDEFGCKALGSVDVTSFASLGSEAMGISQDPSVCPMPCQNVPTAPGLNPDRQHDLTKAIALAFFESNLRGDVQGAQFLKTRVQPENKEVVAQVK
jgi:predicted dienelactone hydrolase